MYAKQRFFHAAKSLQVQLPSHSLSGRFSCETFLNYHWIYIYPWKEFLVIWGFTLVLHVEHSSIFLICDTWLCCSEQDPENCQSLETYILCWRDGLVAKDTCCVSPVSWVQFPRATYRSKKWNCFSLMSSGLCTCVVAHVIHSTHSIKPLMTHTNK